MLRFSHGFFLIISVLTSFSQNIVELSRIGERVEFLDSAKKYHKNALFYLTADACAPCDDMTKRVLANDSVHNLINNFLFTARINVDSELGTYVTKRYQIKKLPSSVIFDRNGSFLTLVRGDVPVKDLLSVLNAALIYEKVMNKLSLDSMSQEDLFFCIETLTYLGKDSAGRVFAKDYLNKVSTDQLLEKDNELVLKNYLSDLGSEKTSYLVKNDKKVTESFGKGVYDEMVRNLFEYNLFLAIEKKDTNLVHQLENVVLKFYLDEKAYKEGESGLWQRYYIGTGQWLANRSEVLSFYRYLNDESYLLNRAAMVLQKYYNIPEMVDNALEWLKIAEYVQKDFENQIMLGQLYLIKKDFKNAKKKVKKARKYANVRSKINRVDDLEYGIDIQTENR